MKFKNFKNKLVRPYIVYADTESSLKKIDDPNKMHEHIANSACFVFICTYDPSQNRIWYHGGEDCIIKMLLELTKLAEECIAKMRENQDMEMTEEDEYDFLRMLHVCHICKHQFGENGESQRSRS